MTNDDIIRMAREAGFFCDADWITYGLPGFERFAALVAAAERNRTWTQAHWTEYEHALVKAEREACADICDQHASVEGIAERCAAAIRARSER